MSSASIRATVQNWFATATIPGLHQVYRSAPWFIDGRQFDLNSNLGNGAVAAVHLKDETESRLTMPAGTGQKQVDYTIGLIIWYQYLLPSGLNPRPVSEDDWVDALDVIIDGVKDRIRQDQGFGTAGRTTFFQAAESGVDIAVQRELPRLLRGKVLSWNVVEFAVTEIITA